MWSKYICIENQYVIKSQVKIPVWKAFINNSCNKGNLLEFLSMSWQHCSLPPYIEFFNGGMRKDPGETLAYVGGVWQVIEALSCDKHEEADTRMIAHLYYCSEKPLCDRVIVESADTDVLLLCMFQVL